MLNNSEDRPLFRNITLYTFFVRNFSFKRPSNPFLLFNSFSLSFLTRCFYLICRCWFITFLWLFYSDLIFAIVFLAIFWMNLRHSTDIARIWILWFFFLSTTSLFNLNFLLSLFRWTLWYYQLLGHLFIFVRNMIDWCRHKITRGYFSWRWIIRDKIRRNIKLLCISLFYLFQSAGWHWYVEWCLMVRLESLPLWGGNGNVAVS